MYKRLNASILFSALLAGGGAAAFHYFAQAPAAQGAASSTALRADDFAIADVRSAMVGCSEAAQMTYAVHWAAACQAQANPSAPGSAEGHAECDLPDDKAAVVNSWLNDAERRCAVEGRT